MTKRSALIESQGDPISLSRALVPELLRTMSEDGYAPRITWNAVDALELLIEAGHFRAAKSLAHGVYELVDGTPRSRLFKGYIALCSLMESGMVIECARVIEEVYVQIQHGGHSTGDRVRASLLLARALFVGVSLGVLPERDLMRCRSVLAAEFERCAEGNNHRFRIQVGLELVKTFIHAAQPEWLQGDLLLTVLEREMAEVVSVSDESLEVLRVRYHIERGMKDNGPYVVSEEDLRRAAGGLGPVAQGLVEISIARAEQESNVNCPDMERALESFEGHQYVSGTLETLLWLADAAMARGHTTKASALFSQVVDVAQRAGVLQPLLLGWVGMLQCAVASGDLDTARSLRKLLEDSLSSDTGICTVGVSVVSAAQNMGDAQRAIALAEKCERFFRGRGLSASEAHALSILGTCFAASGKWSQAKKVWSRAVALEDERRAFISASDKRAALAQAIAMVEYTERGYIAEKVGVQVHELLQEAEECLSLFEAVSAALRAKAKVLSIRAQLCVIAKDSVAAVSHLHKARGIYEELQSPRDVALTDALTGLALMEVGKSKGGELYEEAHVMLQQAHHFFDAPQHNAIRWKLKYYLSISAYLSSQTRGHGDAGSSWRETSATWLRRAMDDVEDLRDEDQLGADAQEFSPGLQPEVLEPLKKALGIKARAAASRRARAAEQLTDDGGYVH